MRFFKHLSTITRHRREVRRNCFKCGLIRQGLTHDLSKFSPAEFIRGVKYYQGDRSPQAREREIFGYSAAWLHHKGRNKHHFEYWVDYLNGKTVYAEMPVKYFVEMICDRIAASKVYLKDRYNDGSALDYFENTTEEGEMNEQTREALRYYLTMLRDKGEKYTFQELKKLVKQTKRKK